MKVLFAIDYSNYSKNAIKLFQRMQVPSGSDVNLMHVNTPEEWPVSSVPGRALHLPSAISALRAKASTHAREVLCELEKVFQGQTLNVHSQVVEGNPGEEILKAVEQYGIDLVVLGPRGLSKFTGFLLGSISEWVLSEATCSVLIGRPQAGQKRTSGPMRILMAIDGSPDTWPAVDFLKTLDFPKSSKLTLVHVVRKHVYQTEQVLFGDRASRDQFAKLAEKIMKDRGREGVTLFEKVRDCLGSSDFTIENRLVFGHEAQEILKAARQTRAELVVVGSKGLTGLRRLLLGSVSHKVVRNASCSVLVVRSPEGKNQTRS